MGPTVLISSGIGTTTTVGAAASTTGVAASTTASTSPAWVLLGSTLLPKILAVAAAIVVLYLLCKISLICFHKVRTSGTLAFGDGSTYCGALKNGKPHGSGMRIDVYGVKYWGTWSHGVLSRSQVMIYHDDGSEYTGPVDEEWRPHGRGGSKKWRNACSTFAPCDTYKGEFLNGCIQGQGAFTYEDGNVFTGQVSFRENIGCDRMLRRLLSGTGTMTYMGGDVYEGSLKNNKRHGQGKQTNQLGAYDSRYKTYDGAWVNDVPDGHGVMEFHNSERYEGQFSQGLWHGSGTYHTQLNRDPDRWMQASIQGTWLHDTVDVGSPVLIRYADGTVYNGFVDAMFRLHGEGTQLNTDHSFYKGSWKSDLRHGSGSITYCDGHVWKGKWNQGYCLQGEISYPNGDRYSGGVQSGEPHGNGTKFELKSSHQDENGPRQLTGKWVKGVFEDAQSEASGSQSSLARGGIPLPSQNSSQKKDPDPNVRDDWDAAGESS